MEDSRRIRSSLVVMGKLIGLVKPLVLVMIVAILLGVLGNIAAILIPETGVLIGIEIMKVRSLGSLSFLVIVLGIAGVSRGFLRYGEQLSNHYIAFKLLALIREKIFYKLRTLAPAKLDGKEKGNLISVITSDIELLEVFYAHTISPIIIGIIVSLVMVFIISSYNIYLGLYSLVAYLLIGLILPLVLKKNGGKLGTEYRNEYGKLSSYYLDSIKGIKELIQYESDDKRKSEIESRTKGIEKINRDLKKKEGGNFAFTDTVILVLHIGFLGMNLYMIDKGILGFSESIALFVGFISSFGPVLALSNLSNNLYQTVAAGNRVLDLLEEEPIITEIESHTKATCGEVRCEDVSFSYGKEKVLDKVSLNIKEGEILGILGKSGSGKSTLIKLIMRFWPVDSGYIYIDDKDIEEIDTNSLRELQGYVTQDTSLFNETIYWNLTLGNETITEEEVKKACKKAAIHQFITSLEYGYDTVLGTFGEGLSSGQKQRIGLARIFLYNSRLVILDEPTSNLDAINEAIVLKSIAENSVGKTVIIISHRKSTMNIATRIFKVEKGQLKENNYIVFNYSIARDRLFYVSRLVC